MSVCIVFDCPGHHSFLEALAHGQQQLARDLRDLRIRIDRNQESTVASFDDLAAAVAAMSSTVTRVAADLQALIAGGNLSAEQQAALDKAVADLTGDTATLDAADPAPAPPAV